MNNEKLKPCPFCNGKAEITESDPSGKENVTHFQISCNEFHCGVMPRANLWHVTEQDAINAWNNRQSPWVNVEDGLPENMQKVLFVSDHGSVISGLFVADETWYDQFNSRIYGVGLDGKPSCWMPTPLIPTLEVSK